MQYPVSITFINSFSLFDCLSTVPQPLPNPVLHTVRSSASSFNLQYHIFPLRLSSKRIRLLLRLPVTSIFPSTFPSIPCFRRQFLCKMWPAQFSFFLFIVCRIFLSSLTLKLLLFLTRWVHLTSVSLQHHISNVLGIPALVPEVSQFQYHIHLRSKCSTYYLLPPIPVQFAGEKNLLLVECWLCNGDHSFNFACTAFIICYHATPTVEMFSILWLLNTIMQTKFRDLYNF